MAQYDLNDKSVVIVIGSGAGGGTLANELCQKGASVVLLEAGKRYSIEDFVNDEWNSFLQLAWLDKRTTSRQLAGRQRLPQIYPLGPARRWAAPPPTGQGRRCASNRRNSGSRPSTAILRAPICSTGR